MLFLKRIALSIFSLALALVAAEFALRNALYRFKDYPKATGPSTSYRVDSLEFKTVVHLNRLNLRNAEIPPKNNREFRILCVGDSFTFGIGVDIQDAWPTLLENKLRKMKKEVTVINGGGPPNARGDYRFLIDIGLALKPDLVIIEIYMNDFYDELPFLEAESAAGSHRSPGASRTWRTWIRTESCLIHFIWTRLIQIQFIDNLLYRFDMRFNQRGIFLRQYPTLETRLINSEFENLENVRALLRGKGIAAVFVVVPAREQILQRQGFLKDPKYDFKKPNKLIQAFMRKGTSQYIDFLSWYENLPVEEVRAFYYTDDMHWTPEGHRYAAKIIAGYVGEHAFLHH